jgi:hypothetical protein
MASELQQKYNGNAAGSMSTTSVTITLNSLANSTAGVGRQATVIDNRTTRYKRFTFSVKFKCGTSPTGNSPVYVYAIRSNKDSTPIRDDSAGASDAAWTRISAELARRGNGAPGILYTKASPATGDVLEGNFVVEDPGPEVAVGIVNGSGVTSDATGGNFTVTAYGELPEAQ